MLYRTCTWPVRRLNDQLTAALYDIALSFNTVVLVHFETNIATQFKLSRRSFKTSLIAFFTSTYRVNTEKVPPPYVTFVAISAVRSDFCMKFYTTVKQ